MSKLTNQFANKFPALGSSIRAAEIRPHRALTEKIFYVLIFSGTLSLSLMRNPLESTYFFGDSWDILYNFNTTWKSFLWLHNEHFIPLFNIFYYLEYRLFGSNHDYYALVSLVLHSVNVCLIFLLTARFIKKRTFRIAAIVIFATSSIYWEDLSWSFQQTFLLCTLLILLSLYLFQLHIETNRRLYLALSTLACLGAGLSVTFGLLSPLLITVYALAASGTFRTTRTQLQKPAWIWLSLVIYIALFFFSGGFSSFPKQTDAHFGLLNVPDIIQYAGYGLTHGLISPTWKFFNITTKHTVLINALIGVVMAGLLLSYFLLERELRSKYLFLAFFMVVPFLLTAVGRFQFGIETALASRYRYLPLIPFALMLSMSAEALSTLGYGIKKVLSIAGIIMLAYYVRSHIQHPEHDLLLDWEKQGRAYMQEITQIITRHQVPEGRVTIVIPDVTLPNFIYPEALPLSKALVVLKTRPPSEMKIIPVNEYLALSGANGSSTLWSYDFESDLTDWLYFGCSSSSSTTAHSGNHAAQVAFQSTLSAFAKDVLAGRTDLGGKLYTFSIFVKTDTPGSVMARIVCKNSKGEILYTGNSNVHPGSNAFEQLDVTALAPLNTSSIGVDVASRSRLPVTAYIDDAVLTQHPFIKALSN